MRFSPGAGMFLEKKEERREGREEGNESRRRARNGGIPYFWFGEVVG